MAGRIWVDRHGVGGARRTGEVVEVLGTPDHARYRIRWADGRESIVAPGSDASLPRAKRPPRARTAPAAAEPAVPPRAEAPRLTAARGDRLVVRAHRLGEPERDGEILAAAGPNGTPPFTVRWSDTGRESSLFPGPDAFVEHLATPAAETPARPRARRPAAG